MPAPALHIPDLDSLDRDITLALAVLRRIRLARSRSSDPDIARAEDHAEWQLNLLLDRRLTVSRG